MGEYTCIPVEDGNKFSHAFVIYREEDAIELEPFLRTLDDVARLYQDEDLGV